MKKEFFAKYLIILLSLFIIVFISTYIIGMKKVKEYYINTLILHLTKTNQMLIPFIETYIKTNNYEQLNKFLKETGNKTGIRITVIDKNGKVLADSKSNPLVMENHRNRIEVEKAFTTGEPGISIRYSSTINEEMLYVALPILQENKINNVIRMSIYLKDINMLIKDLRNDFLWSLTIFSIIIMLISSLFFLKWTNSLNNIIKFSKKIAEGDFSAKLLLKETNEFKELADSLNYMNDKIKNLFEDLKREKEQLQIVINSINELLFVLDSKGIIIMSNNSFKNFINEQEPEGKYYWQIIRNKEIVELVKKMNEDIETNTHEIELSGKVYSCSVSKLKLRNELVFILTDISHIYLLDKLKKDLVENVSHELRTPLTAIKGFIETFEQEAEEKYQNYINIIKRNTERLIKIVNDLLTLSYIETKSTSIVLKKVNVGNIVKNVELLFQNKIQEKNLFLKINIQEDLPEIEGDEIQLENMLINLVENAVNYTEQGGISLYVEKENNFIRIEVSDTGIGIPQESISRIFERFYVVNKSRSRKSGGSGLGLSIVKHIVLMHNGTIDVKSEVGKGTTFIIKLRISS